jgi:predicted dehydrogenase
LHDTDFNWRVLADDAGPLRAVADIGTHWLDLIQFIVGAKVKTVCAELKTVHTTRQRPIGGIETFAGPQSTPTPRTPVAVTTDDYGCVMLRFENGAVGNVVVSQVTAGRKNAIRFELAGSKAALAWESERPNELWIGHRDRANESLIRDPSLLGESARGISTYPGGHNEGFPDSFKHLFCCFYQAIDDGSYVTAPAFPTFADGHQEMVLCDAILRSHRERRWVELYEVDPAS